MYLPLLTKGIANVSENGVEFNGLLFESSNEIQLMWHQTAVLTGGWLIEVLYNPFDLRNIHYYDNDGSAWITFELGRLPIWKVS